MRGLWVTQVSLGPWPAYRRHPALPLSSARPSCPPWSCRECLVHWGGESSQNVIYCPTRALLLLCCCFSWPLKRNSTKVGLNHSLGQGHGAVLHGQHQSHSYVKPAPKCLPGSAGDNVTVRDIAKTTGPLNEDLPWRMKVWLVSSKISQPSTIILSMARFFLMFSVSLTSSCIILSRHSTDRPQGERSIAWAGTQRVLPGKLSVELGSVWLGLWGEQTSKLQAVTTQTKANVRYGSKWQVGQQPMSTLGMLLINATGNQPIILWTPSFTEIIMPFLRGGTN